MASSWGDAWGVSWGDSWGSTGIDTTGTRRLFASINDGIRYADVNEGENPIEINTGIRYADINDGT